MLTFASKRQIIQHFASKGNWGNEFNEQRLMKQFNRLSTKRHGNISLTTDEKDTGFRAHYSTPVDQKNIMRNVLMGAANIETQSRSFIDVLKTGGGFEVQDESGRKFFISQEGVPSDITQIEGLRSGDFENFNAAGKKNNTETIELPDINAVLSFQRDGSKVLFLENSQTTLCFDKPTSYRDSEFIFGGLMNTVSFDEAIAKETGLDLTLKFLEPAKLVVAVDLGIEPEIKLFNKLDPEKAFELLAYLIDKRDNGEAIDPASAKYDTAALQKDWHDSVDFEGYYIANSRRFGIVRESDPNRFVFKFSADAKDFLIAQSLIVNDVTRSNTAPTPLLQKNPALSTLLHALNGAGKELDGHYDRPQPWKSIVLESQKPGAMASTVRKMMIDHFGDDFAGRFVSSISIGENQCMIALESAALSRATDILRASTEVMGLIKEGSTDGKRFEELLAQGADLKYLDPKAAKEGKSFANLILKAGNSALLKSLQDTQGAREVETAEPAP